MDKIFRKIKKPRGFSLMELMIVIVIIGILAAGSLIIFGDKTESAKIAMAKKKSYRIIQVPCFRSTKLPIRWRQNIKWRNYLFSN